MAGGRKVGESMDKIKRETGSFTVEATLTLTSFMIAFLAIMSLSTIARIEGITQYAINQTAKEISQYYYIADKAGLIDTKEGNSDFKQIDSLINTVSSLSDATEEGAKEVEGALSSKDIEEILNKYEELPGTVENVEAAAVELSNNIEAILDDPKAIITSLTSAFAQKAANEAMSKIIAQPLCKSLVPKYITPDGNASDFLKKMGVVDGIDGMDFRLSNFLSDKRSINIVVVYEVELNGFGVFNRTLVIKQTASTAAWVKGQTLEQVAQSKSIWDESSFNRGEQIVAKIKDGESSEAVESGKGIHLYNESTNTFTLIRSINVYNKTYSSFSVGDNTRESDNFTLTKANIKNTISADARKIKSNVKSVGNSLTMEDGSIKQLSDTSSRNPVLLIVLPKEVEGNLEHKKVIEEIVLEIEKEDGVKVEIQYREDALTDSFKR